VDGEVRRAFPKPPWIEALEPSQKEHVTRCLDFFDESRSTPSPDDASLREGSVLRSPTTAAGSIRTKKRNRLKSPSPLVDMTMAHNTDAAREKNERQIAMGEATCVVDCDATEALAWAHLYCSRERVRLSEERQSPARVTVKETTVHDAIFASVRRFPFPLRPREYVRYTAEASSDAPSRPPPR
jgi:hypothetical protein